MRELPARKSLTKRIKKLFGSKKRGTNTFMTRKNVYYSSYYFPKQICDGVDMVAAAELTSKKAAAEMLMRAGLSSYIGKKISDYIASEKIAREQNQKVKMTRFVIMLKRYAKNRGMDISKLI